MDTQEHISRALDSAPDITYRIDAEGTILAISESAGEVLGYEHDDLVGRSMFDLLHPDDLERARAGFAESIRRQDREVRTIEARLVGKSGEFHHFEVHRRLQFDDAGNLEGGEGIARDVTEHRRMEDRLRLHQAIITATSDAVAIFDCEGCFVESNPAHERLLGYSSAELVGKTAAVWCGEQEAARISAILEQSGSFRGEVEARTRGGRELCVEVSVFPVEGETGQTECYVSFAHDVTARRQEEARRRVFEGLREKILLMHGEHDLESVLVALGEGLNELGIEHENCGINLLDTSTEPPGMRSRSTRPGGWMEAEDPRGVQNVERFWRGGETVYRADIEADDPYGECEYLQTRSRIRSIIDVPFTQGTFAINSTRPQAFSRRDVFVLEEMANVLSAGFQRIEDLRMLALSEQRYRTLLETPDFVVLLLDGAGNYVYVSPQVHDWLGLTPDDFYADAKIGERIVHPDDVATVTEVLERGRAGETVEDVEFRFRGLDGTYRWASEGMYPILSEDGSVHTVQVVVHDITRIKDAVAMLETTNRELLETQSRLVQSEKMAALGNLVAGIAHEINTPVGAIHSMHDTLMRAVEKLKETMQEQYPECCDSGSPLARALKVIEQSNKVIETGSERVTNIVRSLRNFARLDQAERKEANLHEGIDDSLMLIHHGIKNRVEVERDYGTIPPVNCYPGRLNQVFLNVLNNAQQAIDGAGKITVSTRQVGVDVHVAITDTGSGIPKEQIARIFDPGFTTKGVGLGTGLGLSICFQIMEDHRGRIDVTSEPGKGSTFTIVVPVDAKLADEP